jgi:hypothetical protein
MASTCALVVKRQGLATFVEASALLAEAEESLPRRDFDFYPGATSFGEAERAQGAEAALRSVEYAESEGVSLDFER